MLSTVGFLIKECSSGSSKEGIGLDGDFRQLIAIRSRIIGANREIQGKTAAGTRQLFSFTDLSNYRISAWETRNLPNRWLYHIGYIHCL